VFNVGENRARAPHRHRKHLADIEKLVGIRF
jgi:hypothetical protein